MVFVGDISTVNGIMTHLELGGAPPYVMGINMQMYGHITCQWWGLLWDWQVKLYKPVLDSHEYFFLVRM